MTTADLERIAHVARTLHRNYSETAQRLQQEQRWRDALSVGQVTVNNGERNALDDAQRSVDGIASVCAEYANLQDELARLAMVHLPDTAERCTLIRRVTLAADSHYYTLRQFDWTEYDRQLHVMECAATRAAIDGKAAKPERKTMGRGGRQRQTPPTVKQLEALKVVGECAQNFAEAGRRLRLDPKTVRQHYNAGLKNAGKLASKLVGRPKVQSAPVDHRGQVNVASGEDGPAVMGPRPRVHRDTRG